MVRLPSRRFAVKIIAAEVMAAFGMRPWNARARGSDRVRVGAIRWDAWYGPDFAPGSSEWYAAHNLDPSQYHRRAPFFATQISPDRMSINGTQDDITAEIAYAAKAGIKYWAFGWYQGGRPLHRAWEYYQASCDKHLVNWCALIGMSSLAGKFPTHADLISYFRQREYEKFGNRPLLYVMHDHSSATSAAPALRALRSACSEAGLGNPYVVVDCSVANTGAADFKSVGADAISAYSSARDVPNGPIPYSVLDKDVRRFWTEMADTGLSIVPNGMTGWDRRPRIDHRPPFDPSVHSPGDYVTPGKPNEIAAHVRAMVSFVRANPRSCPANTALIYSWNENDEGGSVLCPTWSETGPNRAIIDAVSTVLNL